MSPDDQSLLGDAQLRGDVPRSSQRAKKRGQIAHANGSRQTTPTDRPPQGQVALDSSLYINRELSWLAFNQRVLDEASDLRHPLLERVKFLSIVSSNLDEFFMIRVAGIKEQVLADIVEYSPDGQTPSQQLHQIHERVAKMVKDMSNCFWKDLHPRLAAEGIHLLRMNELSDADRATLTKVFAKEIYPVLTPLAFDPGHPFPYISNLSLNLAVVVGSPSGDEQFARVKVPDVLPRLFPIPNGSADDRTFRFVWLEDLIAENLNLLFPGMLVKERFVFRVTRNADIEIQEDEAEDLIYSIEESIRQRRFGPVVRVGIEKTMPSRIKRILVENLEVMAEDVYELTPPFGMSHLMALTRVPRPDLKDEAFHPAVQPSEEDLEDIFASIRHDDIILHHPYDSFSPVVQFIKSAVEDPNVLAIKQTLYRIGKESPLIPLLVEAAENGKQVAVLVELKARFDEENNIEWAKQLERAGVHVVYGLVGLKTHGKMALVVRKEHDGLRRYVHLGTGNYNPVTARIYTDLSYMTCRSDITEDVTEVFNALTGYSKRNAYTRLAVAPVTLRERVIALINREIEHAKAGRGGQIIMKMNALTDVSVIGKFYEASKAGVKIDLIIRGICSLRPGVKGVSESITVVSVVGRYLEHSRVFWFANGGSPELYLSSADMMGRNLDRRVELMFPVDNREAVEKICRETLVAPLADMVRGRLLSSDGSYSYRNPKESSGAEDSQQSIMHVRNAQARRRKAIPRESPPASQG
ncbi:MAG TPA: polyphosphate kinase 1 [Bacteroidota bacterium]|nr:polyphosphate kinase 1 [Bacteroidota bacterium]